MQYVAFLRGVNVGGNNRIMMPDLRAACKKAGLQSVSTYVETGNILFSLEQSPRQAKKILETTLFKAFQYQQSILLRTLPEMKGIIQAAPQEWKVRKDIRCYVVFLPDSLLSEEVIKSMELREGIDWIVPGQGVLYLTTLESGLTKSRLKKILGKELFSAVVVRTFTATQHLPSLMWT